jgi:hypothetical protein
MAAKKDTAAALFDDDEEGGLGTPAETLAALARFRDQLALTGADEDVVDAAVADKRRALAAQGKWKGGSDLLGARADAQSSGPRAGGEPLAPISDEDDREEEDETEMEDDEGDEDDEAAAAELLLSEEEFEALSAQLDQADRLADMLLAQATSLETRLRATLDASRRDRAALQEQAAAALERGLAAAPPATDRDGAGPGAPSL